MPKDTRPPFKNQHQFMLGHSSLPAVGDLKTMCPECKNTAMSWAVRVLAFGTSAGAAIALRGRVAFLRTDAGARRHIQNLSRIFQVGYPDGVACDTPACHRGKNGRVLGNRIGRPKNGAIQIPGSIPRVFISAARRFKSVNFSFFKKVIDE